MIKYSLEAGFKLMDNWYFSKYSVHPSEDPREDSGQCVLIVERSKFTGLF